jgi:osmoprotectant transport system ATP-binding protein
VSSVPAHELRRGIGYVIQQAGLFPHRKIVDNIATVPHLLGWDRRRARSRALELLELVGLDPATADRYPAQLSGGQQQRVGVARALAADPPVLLMDEPFGAVDPVMRAELQREFLRLQQELHKTVVFVTHDIDEAVLLGSTIALFRTGGELVQHAQPADLLARPADPFVASFLGGDRGLKLLSLNGADSVPTRPVPTVVVGEQIGASRTRDEWVLLVDAAGRPLRWLSPSSVDTGVVADDAVAASADPVGPGASLRTVLDRAVSSPARAAVRVDDAGRLVGVIPFADLAAHLPGASPCLAAEAATA